MTNANSCCTCWKYHTAHCEPAQCLKHGRPSMWEREPPNRWGTCDCGGKLVYAHSNPVNGRYMRDAHLYCKDCGKRWVETAERKEMV